MKFSWKSFKISISGAKLSHLVQKDKIWDHGTMVELVRIIFWQVQKVKREGETEMLKKFMTEPGYQAFVSESGLSAMNNMKASIKEVAIIDVSPGKNKKPDRFTALLNCSEMVPVTGTNEYDRQHEFSEKWCFVRQGDWWLLDNIVKQKVSGLVG